MTPPSSSPVQLGGTPRVHLLPPEIEDDRRARSVTRRLAWGVAVAVVLVLAGTAIAFFQVTLANAALVNEQSRAAHLIMEQKKYAQVTTIQQQITGITAAQPVAADGEVLWAPFVAKVQATLPTGTTITAFTGSLVGVAPTQLLQAPHVATLSITCDSPQASVSDWLDNLGKLAGFVDATPKNVVLVVATGRYTVDVDLLVDDAVLAKRFTGK
jgi:hypothetical protein